MLLLVIVLCSSFALADLTEEEKKELEQLKKNSEALRDMTRQGALIGPEPGSNQIEQARIDNKIKELESRRDTNAEVQKKLDLAKKFRNEASGLRTTNDQILQQKKDEKAKASTKPTTGTKSGYEERLEAFRQAKAAQTKVPPDQAALQAADKELQNAITELRKVNNEFKELTGEGDPYLDYLIANSAKVEDFDSKSGVESIKLKDEKSRQFTGSGWLVEKEVTPSLWGNNFDGEFRDKVDGVVVEDAKGKTIWAGTPDNKLVTQFKDNKQNLPGFVKVANDLGVDPEDFEVSPFVGPLQPGQEAPLVVTSAEHEGISFAITKDTVSVTDDGDTTDYNKAGDVVGKLTEKGEGFRITENAYQIFEADKPGAAVSLRIDPVTKLPVYDKGGKEFFFRDGDWLVKDVDKDGKEILREPNDDEEKDLEADETAKTIEDNEDQIDDAFETKTKIDVESRIEGWDRIYNAHGLNPLPYLASILDGYNEFSGLSAYSSLFADDEALADKRRQAEEDFCNSILGFTAAQCLPSKMCQSQFGNVAGTGIITQAAIGATPRSSAHIQGEKGPASPFVYDEETGEYREGASRVYKITYHVRNPGDGPMTYNLLFRHDGGDFLAFPQSKSVSGSVSRKGSSAIIKESETDYHEVCLILEPPISDWQGNAWPQFCSPIVDLGGEAPSVPKLINISGGQVQAPPADFNSTSEPPGDFDGF